MRIAVTGASGFVGRHLLADLSAHGVTLVAATRDPGRLAAWAGRAEVVELDIAAPSPHALECLAAVDVLVHLAWDGLPNYTSRRHYEVELPRQYAFLKEVVTRGVPAVVAAGTCAEYGMRSGELAEELEPVSPNAYGFAKDALRRQLEYLRRDVPFALTWARMFYMYGDGQPSSSLYTQLAAAAARGDATFDMSRGEQLRDFLPVTTVAQLVAELALTPRDTGIVNVCAGRPTSVRRLVETWIAENGWTLHLNLGRYPYPDYEPLAFWGSRRKLDMVRGRNGE